MNRNIRIALVEIERIQRNASQNDHVLARQNLKTVRELVGTWTGKTWQYPRPIAQALSKINCN